MLLAILAAVSVVLAILVVLGTQDPDASPAVMIPLIAALVAAPTVLAVLWIPRRNVARIITLRSSHPEALVFGAQADPLLDQEVQNSFPLPGAQRTTFGQLVTVLVNAEGISFWKGAGSNPDRRALIPWRAVRQVTAGQVTLARPLTSIRVEFDPVLTDAGPVDFVPNREGLWSSAAVLDPARIRACADAIEQVRKDAVSGT